MTYIVALADFVRMVWLLSAAMIDFARLFGADLDHRAFRPLRWLFAELRPFYLPAVAIYIADLVISGTVLGWNTLNIFFALVSWWIYKDVDKDDRWKRRKKKLAEKIERRGARLVAVPVGGES